MQLYCKVYIICSPQTSIHTHTFVNQANFLAHGSGWCHKLMTCLHGIYNPAVAICRDQPIMLFLPIMLCCSALKIHLLCSILCSRTRIVVRLLCYLYTILHEQQWRSYTRAHLGTGPGINSFGPGIKNQQESRDYLLINGS